MKYREDIDGLRGLAVLLVLIFHAWPRLLPGGFIGVDVFFVISGYLISGILLNDLQASKFSLTHFYARRVKRIFPALAMVLTLSLLLGWRYLLAGEYQSLGRQTAGAAGFVPNLLALQDNGYFDPAAASKPLMHLWSLGIEEQFYLAWPLLLALAFRWSRGPAVLIAGLAAASLVACLAITPSNANEAFFSPFTRCWELLAGASLALFRPWTWAGFRSHAALGWSGLAIIVASALVVRDGQAFPGWRAGLPVLGAAAVVASNSDGQGYGRWLGGRFWVGLGLISYPLYLYHWPALFFLHRLWTGPAWASEPLALLGAVLAAWLTWRGIERPMRAPGWESVKVGLLALVVAFLAGAGLWVQAQGGFDRRPINLRISRAVSWADWKRWYRVGDCLLEIGQGPSSFKAACLEPAANGADVRPLVLLWGDSYAAALYQGLLNDPFKARYRLAQFTMNGCLPALGLASLSGSHCPEVNSAVLGLLKRHRPRLLVVAANWNHYRSAEGHLLVQAAWLRGLVHAARQAGVGKVLVLGQLPVFPEGQPAIGLRDFIPNVNDRGARGLDPQVYEADAFVRLAVEGTGAEFVSPLDALCNGEGCLLSARRDRLEPLAWDAGHLTAAGSRFVVAKLGLAHKF